MSNNKYRVIVPTTETWREMVKCQAACPVFTDARGYVTAMARGELELGYEIAHDPNPLSTICGRICGAPCEIACRRGDLHPGDEPVAIRPIKRILTERYGPEAEKQVSDSGQNTKSQSADLQEDGSGSKFFSVDPQKEFSRTRDIPGKGTPKNYSPVRWSHQELRRLATFPRVSPNPASVESPSTSAGACSCSSCD